MKSKLLTSFLKKDDLFRGFNFRASQDRVQNTEQPAPVNSRRNSFQFSKVASYAGRLRSQFCLRPCRRRLLETRAKKLRRGRLKNRTKETGSLVTRRDKSKLSVGFFPRDFWENGRENCRRKEAYPVVLRSELATRAPVVWRSS